MRLGAVRASLLVSAALLTGCVTTAPGEAPPAVVTAAAAEPVSLHWAAERDSGAWIAHVRHDEGNVSFEGFVKHRRPIEDYSPLYVALVFPNGTVRPVLWGMDGDLADHGHGDGVVYAEAGGAEWRSPAILPAPREGWTDMGFGASTTAREATLVVLWANLANGQLELDLNWSAGAVVEPRWDGPAEAAELVDFDGGAQLGTPLVGATVGGRVTLGAPGLHAFGYLKLTRTSGALGTVALDASPHQKEFILGHPGNASCLCPEGERFVFTAEGPVRAAAEFVGYSKAARAYLVVAAVPPGLLPPGVAHATYELV